MSRSRWRRWCWCLTTALLCGCTQYPSGGDLRLHSDMIDQPSFRPQKDPRPLPEGSVPVRGWEAPMSREEAQRRLRNPVPVTAESLGRGEKLFHIYCSPCHGVSGHGDGTVAPKMVKPANIIAEKYVRSTDGFFYDVIRHGSGLMPPYAESLAPDERWYVITYIRRLQKR